MDFVKNLGSQFMEDETPKPTNTETEPTPTTTTTTPEHDTTSKADLMSSAKVVAEAAQAAASRQTDKIDKAKVAGAAEELLEAAQTYGKLDDKEGVGQYIDKAQGYLHNMHSGGGGGGGGGDGEVEKPSGGGGGGEDGGPAGGIMKMAQGFFK